MPRMRRRNRQLKVTIDIPDDFDNDDNFMEALMDRMDDQSEDGGWCIQVGVDDDMTPCTITKMALGDVEIEPEGDE